MNGESTARHALVVGGTGMLRGVCLQLARDGWMVSVIARDRPRLHELGHEFVGRISPLPVDYKDSNMLGAGIRSAAVSFGPISLVIAWIHDTAPDAARIIAKNVSATSATVRYFHVLGGSTVDPSCLQPEVPAWVESLPTMRYRRIILGFVIEDGRSRWLTDEEICGGIESAIARDDETIVGVIEPWHRRP